MRHDIIIAGVGGQGILTIARVLSLVAMAKGLNVKQAEVHGMSQRGGAVYSHLRISDQEIFSDLIPAGQADMILAIEPLEALRYVSMLRKDGTVVASTNAEVNISDYPAIERVLAHIAEFDSHIAIDMEKLARAAGGVLSANIVSLGAASLYLGFTIPELKAAVEQLFEAKGEKVVQTNIRALRFGRTAASAYREALERGVAPQHARGWIATVSPEHLANEDLDFAELDDAVDESRLTGAEAHAFESLLRTAYDEDRRQLYEHEVYRLIELVGAITPPRHAFIAKSSTISEEVLSAYPGDRVVIKLVSAGVVHKTEAGAVKIVPKDLARVRSEIEQMVNRHAAKVSVAGVLVVEFVEHDAHAIGSELFVGIRATREFGPVIAAGLGGVQTEYLASKMRPGVAVAKAVASDTDAESFLELFKATVAYDVLSGRVRGQDRVVSDGELLRCFRVFLSIARQFCVDRGEEGPDISELEVNPFAFVNQHLVPLDGRGSLRPAAKPRLARPPGAAAHLLEPEQIALVGVSSKPGSFGGVILANILESGFPADRVSIIKSGETEFNGVRCVPTLNDLPEPVDLLVITVPAGATSDIIREANASGKVRSGIIISGGAGEAEGSEAIGEAIDAAVLEARLLDDGPVFLGPNCMGVRSHPGAYDTFFVPKDKLPSTQATPRPIALVSQSGAFIVSRLSSYGDLNPRFAISIGNQCDLTVSDMVREVGSREDILVVGVYLEGFIDLDGAAMLQVVADLKKQGKSVVFYKAGRTESGRSAAAGHTAAVAGDYEICHTAIQRAGAYVAQDFHEFSEAIELAVYLSGRDLGQGRVFALTNAGMEAVAIADSGVQLAPLSEDLVGKLDALLTQHHLRGLVSPRNPLDVTPAANEDAYAELVEAALADDAVDAVIVSCVPLAPALRTLAADLEHPSSFVQLAKQWRSRSDKAIITVFDGGAEYDALRAQVREAGLPVFRAADHTARLLSRWIEQMILGR